MKRATQAQFKLGDHIAAILIPGYEEIEIAQTTRDVHHYSIYASVERLLALVQLPVLSIEFNKKEKP